MAILLASDVNNPDYVNPKDPDSAIRTRFYKRAVFQPFESEQEKRQIFKDVTYIEISTPGDDKNIIDLPLRDDHIQRFKARYEHYLKHGEDAEHGGVSLSKWALLQPSQVEMLRAVKFYTVEQVAGASDQQIMSVGMIVGMAGASFRDRARQYLTSLRSESQNDALAAQSAARDKEIEDLRAKDAAREKEMSDMRAMLEKLTAPSGKASTITKETAKAA